MQAIVDINNFYRILSDPNPASDNLSDHYIVFENAVCYMATARQQTEDVLDNFIDKFIELRNDGTVRDIEKIKYLAKAIKLLSRFCLSTHDNINVQNTILDGYPELLTTNDICQIFGVSERTVSNWENKGYFVNISETNSELDSLGRRVRGKEKRYRKQDIIENIELQKKLNK